MSKYFETLKAALEEALEYERNRRKKSSNRLKEAIVEMKDDIKKVKKEKDASDGN